MLITIGQLHTPIMEITGGKEGGLEVWGWASGAGPAWCVGSAQSPPPPQPTHTHTLTGWVLAGLSGSGAARRGYRRSFLSV